MEDNLLNEVLLQQIELKRQLMIQSGMEHGLQSQKTLQLSKQVDQLMNQFEQTLSEKVDLFKDNY